MVLRRYVVLFVLLLAASLFAYFAGYKPARQTVWEGDFFVKDAHAFDGFENLQVIRGNLIVSDTSVRRIELPALRVVSGDVRILNNQNLVTLEGLGSLVGIGGSLRLEKNPSLQSLVGVESLTVVGGKLELVENQSLESLAGAESLVALGQGLSILRNDGLASIEGLGSVRVVGGWIDLTRNDSLRTLKGFEPDEVRGDVVIDRWNRADDDVIEDWLVRRRSKHWLGKWQPFNGLNLTCHGGGCRPKKASDIHVTRDWLGLDGDLDPSQIEEVDNRNRLELSMCFMDNIEWYPDVRGRIVVAYTILANGEVSDLKMVRDSYWAELGTVAITKCMARKMRAWRYPPSAHEQPTTVTIRWGFFH